MFIAKRIWRARLGQKRVCCHRTEGDSVSPREPADGKWTRARFYYFSTGTPIWHSPLFIVSALLLLSSSGDPDLLPLLGPDSSWPAPYATSPSLQFPSEIISRSAVLWEDSEIFAEINCFALSWAWDNICGIRTLLWKSRSQIESFWWRTGSHCQWLPFVEIKLSWCAYESVNALAIHSVHQCLRSK